MVDVLTILKEYLELVYELGLLDQYPLKQTRLQVKPFQTPSPLRNE